jgi:hypothetical protein
MVIIAIPQVEAEQDEVVAVGGGAGGAAGAAGAGMEGDTGDIDDIDEPPPQAPKAATSKVQAAAGNHRRRIADALVGRFVCCMDVLPAIVVQVSAHTLLRGYTPARRRAPENRVTSSAWLRRGHARFRIVAIAMQRSRL